MAFFNTLGPAWIRNDKAVNLTEAIWDPDLDFLGGYFDIGNGCYNWDLNDAMVINGYYGKILEPLIPSDIVQWIASKGDLFVFVVQVRTDANNNRNNNRSYSNGVAVTDLFTTTIMKKKQVTVVPLN